MPKKILIIEDDNILQKAMKDALEAEGYQVIQAFDGDSGYKKIINTKPDLIILDLLMPFKPGEWVLKNLHEKGIIDKCPLIVLTVKSDTANINNLKSLGVKHYMPKSDYSLAKLDEEVKKLLKHKY